MEAIFLDCGISGPQLKRNPLGICTTNIGNMADTPLRTLVSKDGRMKVELFRRQDGTFGFQEWHYHRQEATWAPFGRRSICISDSLEGAEIEARDRVEWLGSDEQADA